ncbi:hypothetical protein, conserved [Eimeria tenella]|uniref:Uncharacterized protein n=1 Tax=Eimeria tenella TaxID=5802 RepID=U6KZD4_EIMTE|nr:hypothetical protein, conserved [Eimeria tenella]CDJ43507.1 hypothetical protein, conserved [Eimeria tenella]|eukprot:XP_013234257.1 hypothetical protein, conserved [Eimeria tenella]
MEPKWSQNGDKMEPKWSQNGAKKETKKEPKWRQNGAKMETKWSQKGDKKEPKWRQNGAKMEPKWSQKGDKKEPKWRQNGAKKEPKRSQNGAKKETKRSQKGDKKEPKWRQKGAKMEPKWSQNGAKMLTIFRAGGRVEAGGDAGVGRAVLGRHGSVSLGTKCLLLAGDSPLRTAVSLETGDSRPGAAGDSVWGAKCLLLAAGDGARGAAGPAAAGDSLRGAAGDSSSSTKCLLLAGDSPSRTEAPRVSACNALLQKGTVEVAFAAETLSSSSGPLSSSPRVLVAGPAAAVAKCLLVGVHGAKETPLGLLRCCCACCCCCSACCCSRARRAVVVPRAAHALCCCCCSCCCCCHRKGTLHEAPLLSCLLVQSPPTVIPHGTLLQQGAARRHLETQLETQLETHLETQLETLGDAIGDIIGDTWRRNWRHNWRHLETQLETQLETLGDTLGDTSGDRSGDTSGDAVRDKIGDITGDNVGDTIGGRIREKFGDKKHLETKETPPEPELERQLEARDSWIWGFGGCAQTLKKGLADRADLRVRVPVLPRLADAKGDRVRASCLRYGPEGTGDRPAVGDSVFEGPLRHGETLSPTVSVAAQRREARPAAARKGDTWPSEAMGTTGDKRRHRRQTETTGEKWRETETIGDNRRQ